MNFATEITCPVCMGPLAASDRTCPKQECGFCLPRNYYQTCREAPPLPIAAVGYANHGKTHLLASILLTLNDLTKRRGVTFRALDDWTQTKQQGWVDTAERTGTLPPTEDQSTRTIPMILRVTGLFPARTLLVYDVAGESFHSMAHGHERLPVLQAIQTVWFLISPVDLERPVEDDPSRRRNAPRDSQYLVGSYIAALHELHSTAEGRHAVVVVTKGDKVAELSEYLESDPLQERHSLESVEPFSLKAYESGLRQAGPRVEDYICRVRDVQNMVGLLREAGMGVSFSITSALGKDPVEGFLPGERSTGAPWARQRVLDPLFWTLLLEKEHGDAQANVILDPGSAVSPGYPACGDGTLPDLLWNAMPRRQNVRAWFLGQSSPATSPGKPLPAPPPRGCRWRLIGRLLDPLGEQEFPKGRIVLITNEVVLDLPDFRQGEWAKRLLLITTSDRAEVREQWPQTRVITSAVDLEEVVEFMNPPR